jgi:hypothetical protein
MPTPEQLREEARSAEQLAKLVSYAPDKQWLLAKAAALQREADRQEQLRRRRNR